MVVHSYNPSTGGTGGGMGGQLKVQELGVQGQPWLYGKFQASLVYRRPCLKKQNKMTKQERKESTFDSVTRKHFQLFLLKHPEEEANLRPHLTATISKLLKQLFKEFILQLRLL